MKLLSLLQSLFSKTAEATGVNKGDATSGLMQGGLTLGLIYFLFVSAHQYEIDQRARDDRRAEDYDAMVAENSKLWHQVHVTMDALNARGIYVPTAGDNLGLEITNAVIADQKKESHETH